jgi:hypothetical protein
MFNPSKLANEVFNVLRSFDYTVSIFDYDGNRVYEPEAARRFFATPKNITVSIYEDSENSIVKLFLSQSTNIDEVSGLIETMRTTASRYGILFNVRKYQKELAPKDLAPNSGIENEPGMSLNSSNDDFELSSHLTAIKADLENIRDELPTTMAHLKSKRKVNEMSNNHKIDINESNEVPMMKLPALGSEVEISAWDSFKSGSINLLGDPEEVDRTGDINQYRVDALRAIADKTAADGLASVFTKIADAIEAGSRDQLLVSIADKATDIIYLTKEPVASVDDTVSETTKEETIHLPPLGVDVEKEAWDNFKNGSLSLYHAVSFTENMGRGADPLPFNLRKVAEACSDHLLSVLFSTVADDLENTEEPIRMSPESRKKFRDTLKLKKTIAERAIEAARKSSPEKEDTDDSVIVTESVREFNSWFDSFNLETIFESEYDAEMQNLLRGDNMQDAMDVAYTEVEENFDVNDFLKTHGDDFYYNDETLEANDKVVETNTVKSSLRAYIEDALEQALDGNEYTKSTDIDELSDNLLPIVKEEMMDNGWAFEDITDEMDITDDEPMLENENELANEDVLLPKDARNDLIDEVKAKKDEVKDEPATPEHDPEVKRLIDLATNKRNY